MDDPGRIGRPMSSAAIQLIAQPRPAFRPRRRANLLDKLATNRWLRGGVRAAAAAFLLITLAHGLSLGGHLSASSEQPRALGRVASWMGYAADHIRIAGLKRQRPEAVLNVIGVTPGASLIGFDAAQAKSLLENIDWVATADVRRIFPNQLEISISEREPFALWQREGRYYVIDQTGAAMSMDPQGFAGQLPLVAGEGAQQAVAGLVNDLESYPGLRSRMVAAARVGQRRWTLYFAHGLRAELPEEGNGAALGRLDQLAREQGVLDKGIDRIDLRLPDRIVIVPTPDPDAEKPAEKSGAGSRG